MVATAFLGPVVGASFKSASAATAASALKGLALTGAALGGVSHDAVAAHAGEGGDLHHDAHGEVHGDHEDHGDIEDHEHGDHDHGDHEEHEHGEHEEHDDHEDHGDHDDHEEHGEHEEHEEDYEDHNEHGEEHEELEDAAEEVETNVEVGNSAILRVDREQDGDKVAARGADVDEDAGEERGVLWHITSRVTKVTMAAALMVSAASRLVEARSKDLGLAPLGDLASSCVDPHGRGRRKESAQAGLVRAMPCGGATGAEGKILGHACRPDAAALFPVAVL
eukprot:TRINITY_DN71947_c0_g1_i1.p1 TRINITY_DN71947_c0_g1~~TRINITY_DN71947_c0_g1_i1.p1  ORF type:complete len:279 (-),score=78.21 TRINITY_DN71947_c0_g1_i1:211-1047(-)